MKKKTTPKTGDSVAVCANIQKIVTTTSRGRKYRVRKMKDGVVHDQRFNSLRAAKEWLKNL